LILPLDKDACLKIAERCGQEQYPGGEIIY
jgi:hypothetical protein